MVTSVTNTSSSAAASTGSALGTQTSAAAQQDRFLKLLVAQLNNQDPMNPMDNAQITSQMAQINTVSGIQELNTTMKSMASQFMSLQMMQGASMIGHDVLLKSDTLTVNNGKATGTIDLADNADKVSVQIQTPGGELLGAIELGAQTAGRHSFTWDASNYKGTANPIFKITATQGKQPIVATALAQDTVTGVGTSGDGLSLQFKNRSAVGYDAIQGIL